MKTREKKKRNSSVLLAARARAPGWRTWGSPRTRGSCRERRATTRNFRLATSQIKLNPID